MCARSERNFACPGCSVANGAAHGSTVIRNGGRATHCEPRASAAEVATIRCDVIAKEGAFGGATPLRAVALSLANASNGATHALPESGPLKRSAQNAAYRARKRAQVHGEAGAVPNYRSLEELPIPQSDTRRADGENFLLHDSGPGAIGYFCLVRKATPDRLRRRKSGPRTEPSRFARRSGSKFTLFTRWSAGTASRAYTHSCRINRMALICGCGRKSETSLGRRRMAVSG